MANEEDNFDIDLYGDNTGEGENPETYKDDEVEFTLEGQDADTQVESKEVKGGPEVKEESQNNGDQVQAHTISSTTESNGSQLQVPKQAPQQQGLKRKESSDDRPIDPGATSAVLISDLHWFTTEDDLRGWANQAECEDELKDVTFSEHKVNGKSKGQAFIEFSSAQAATAAKRKIDSFATGQQSARKYTVTYTNPMTNPFKTLPKDGPLRGKDDRNQRGASTGYNNQAANTNSYNTNSSGGFRGGRGGGYGNRGGMNNNMRGGFNNNQNFSNPMGGFQTPQTGGFQGSNMGAMQNYSGFNNRGGMMNNNMRGGGGMRGGRGGMNTGVMPMANMANMGNMGNMGMGGMGGMGMGMAGNMNPMMGTGMQGGFQGAGNTHFNPGFFQNQSVGGGPTDGSWNPHGAKRTRQE